MTPPRLADIREPGRRIVAALLAAERAARQRAELALTKALELLHCKATDDERAASFTGAHVSDERYGSDGSVELTLEVTLLRWRQLVIEDDQIRRTRSHGAFQFLHLPAADEGGGIWFLAPLEEFADDGCSRAGGQLAQFGHGLFRRKSAMLLVFYVQVGGGRAAGHAGAGQNGSGGLTS